MKNLSSTQINTITNNTFNSPLLTFKSGEHYSDFLGKITFMPTTVAQAKAQVKKIKNGYDNLLMCGEWNLIELFLNKHGFNGQYNLTKSRTMCRLANVNDLVSAIKKEFQL